MSLPTADSHVTDGQTPLTLAVLRNDRFAVDKHLSDNIDVVALRTAFTSRSTDRQIVDKLLRAMLNRYLDIDELTDKLFEANCQLYHAALSRDVRVFEGLARRGVRDVEWRNCQDRTALHVAAAASNQLPLVTRLVEAGANVNAVDRLGRDASCLAAFMGNAEVLRFLLENGADARTAFDACLRGSDECAEMLLLLHDKVPIIVDERKLLDETGGYYKSNLLIGYAALRGGEVAESLVRSERRLAEYRERYERCRRMLETGVFEGLTLGDVLTASRAKFRGYMRRVGFYETLTRFQMEVLAGYDNVCVYYSRAIDYRARKCLPKFLEDEAILAISRLFDGGAGSFGRCYVFGRKVTEYLSRRDVFRLCRACERA